MSEYNVGDKVLVKNVKGGYGPTRGTITNVKGAFITVILDGITDEKIHCCDEIILEKVTKTPLWKIS